MAESQTPRWYQSGDALGSAVHYLSKASHTRIKVGVGVCGTAIARNADINVPDVRTLDNYLACSVETRSELVVLIRDQKGVVVGQVDIDSHTEQAFGPAEEQFVRQIADELGALWPREGM